MCGDWSVWRACGEESLERALREDAARFGGAWDETDAAVAEWLCAGSATGAPAAAALRWPLLGRAWSGCSAARASLVMLVAQRSLHAEQRSYVSAIRRLFRLCVGCDAVRRARLYGSVVAPCPPALSLLLMQLLSVEFEMDVSCVMIRSVFSDAWGVQIPPFAVDAQVVRAEALVKSLGGAPRFLQGSPVRWGEHVLADLVMDLFAGNIHDVLRAALVLDEVFKAHSEDPACAAAWFRGIARAISKLRPASFPFFYVFSMYFEHFNPACYRLLGPLCVGAGRIPAAARILSRTKSTVQETRSVCPLAEPGPAWTERSATAAAFGKNRANPIRERRPLSAILHIKSPACRNDASFDNRAYAKPANAFRANYMALSFANQPSREAMFATHLRRFLDRAGKARAHRGAAQARGAQGAGGRAGDERARAGGR